MHHSRPRILVFPLELMAHYIRTIRLAQELGDDYEFLFVSSDRYSPFLEQAGFSTFECPGMDASKAVEDAKSFSFDWLNEPAIDHAVSRQVEAIREYDPVAVIVDAEPTLPMAAEYCGVPSITLANGYMSRFYGLERRVPKVHFGAKYAEKLPPKMFNWISTVAQKAAFKALQKPFNKQRKKLGLSTKANYLLEQEGDVVLLCDLPEIHPQHSLPENYHWVGPLLPKPESETRALQIAEKPRICVCMGSSGDWELVSALKELDDQKFEIISLGDKNEVLKGENVTSLAHADLHQVIPYCDVMVCHGGNGTSYFGVLYGKPMVFVPSMFEQEWNVARLIELGHGLECDRTDELPSLIEEAMKLEVPTVEWDGGPSVRGDIRMLLDEVCGVNAVPEDSKRA